MINACKLAIPHLRLAERPPHWSVNVPAFGIYGEASNRKLQFVGLEPNSCPFRRWPFLFLQQFV